MSDITLDGSPRVPVYNLTGKADEFVSILTRDERTIETDNKTDDYCSVTARDAFHQPTNPEYHTMFGIALGS